METIKLFGAIVTGFIVLGLVTEQDHKDAVAMAKSHCEELYGSRANFVEVQGVWVCKRPLEIVAGVAE